MGWLSLSPCGSRVPSTYTIELGDVVLAPLLRKVPLPGGPLDEASVDHRPGPVVVVRRATRITALEPCAIFRIRRRLVVDDQRGLVIYGHTTNLLDCVGFLHPEPAQLSRSPPRRAHPVPVWQWCEIDSSSRVTC